MISNHPRRVVAIEDETSRLVLRFNSESGRLYSLEPLAKGDETGKGVSGFYSMRGARDIAVAMQLDPQHSAPDWDSEVLMSVNGQLFLKSEVLSFEFKDRLLCRSLEVVLRTGEVLSISYRPRFREWLVPADPMFPWASDIYAFMANRVLTRHQDM